MAERIRTVLVVDDEALIREVLAQALIQDGYQVATAGDGEEGLDAFDEHQPDLVITDVWMPKLNGVNMVLRLREGRPDLNAIFISGFFGTSPSRDDMTDTIARLGYPLLPKPFNLSKLRNQVRSTLQAA